MKYQILIGLMLMTCTWVSAQNDTPRRWALDAHAGGVKPIPSHTDGVGISSLSSIGIPDSHSGLLTKLHAEYYIPFSPFSVKGGYEHEEMGLLGGDAYADVNQLMLGGRYYPAPAKWVIQPYAGLDTYYNIGEKTKRIDMAASSSDHHMDYTRKGIIRMPAFSAAPVVGVDIYIFTCIAIQMEYGFRMGIGPKTEIDSKYNSNPTVFHTTTHYHRHTFTVGLKLSFPFRWTRADGDNLIEGLFDCLFY